MIKILLAGEGGQGVQTVAKIITLACQATNQKASYIPSFGVEQRGGVSLAYIQIDQNDIPYSRFDQADIVVVFCDRAIPIVKKFLTKDTTFIYDDSAIHDKNLEEVKSSVQKYLAVSAQKIAQEKYSPKVLNMIILGALSTQLEGIDLETIKAAVTKTLGAKFEADPKIKEMNFSAITDGIQAIENFDSNKTEFIGAQTKEIQQEFSDDKKTWTRFPEYCKGCSLCVTRCPVQALKDSSDVGFLGTPLPIVDINTCIACGMCEKTCPDGAIRIEKKS